VDEEGGLVETFTLTVAPPSKQLNPNRVRGNSKWAAVARSGAKKRSRNMAEMIVLSEMQAQGVKGGWKGATVQVTWYFPTQQFLDKDNARAMLKGVQDGCTRAGLWIDDNDVDIVSVDRQKDANHPRVVLVCTQTK
jgi:Holliday junction resolvase RusA-like endonuclease